MTSLTAAEDNRRVSRDLLWRFDFSSRYEITVLERIERLGGKNVSSYPGALPVHPSQELADCPHSGSN
jgi:hypothetical protein